MSLNFPTSANIGDIYTSDNISYEFSGVKWVPVNRTDYTVQASDVTAVGNSLVIDMSVDGVQLLTLSEEAVVSFTGVGNINEYKRVLLDFSINPDYIDVIETSYDIINSVYEDGKLKSVNAQDSAPYGISFKPDGTKMYIMGSTNDTVYQYALSTPWEVQTAVYEPGKLKPVNAQDTGPVGLFFKPDGTKMYIVGLTNDTVYQYALSTPWEVQTAVYETGKLKSVAAQETNPHSLSFKSDGTKMYIVGNATDTVYQYALSTPWEVQTAVYEPGKLKSVAAQDTNPLDISFKPDGTKMYIMGITNDSIFEYILLTPWDVSSAIYVAGKFKSVASEEGSPTAIFFKPDGTKMYMMGTNTDTVYQYNTLITTQDTIANVIWPETIEWEDGVAPNLPKLSETALIEIEARTDYRGTNYTGRLVGRNF